MTEIEILKGRVVEYRSGDYVIVPSDNPDQRSTDFRVVNIKTGAESSLYSYLQCAAIIGFTQREELKGSFDI